MSKLLFDTDDYKRITGVEFMGGMTLEEYNRQHPHKQNPRKGTAKLRAAILKEKVVCEQCGSDDRLVVHHKIRIADGGVTSKENLILLCKKCHNKAHPTGTRFS